jgi:hypothetical protein
VQLPRCTKRSKVEESKPLANVSQSLSAPILEVTLTSRLRELIQQLGEAIHESVIESEQIAGVVQDIRKQGFDVLLMLEATIGLNEVTENETDETEEADGTAFTKNDRDWLRRLRISVEGEDGTDTIEGE